MITNIMLSLVTPEASIIFAVACIVAMWTFFIYKLPGFAFFAAKAVAKRIIKSFAEKSDKK